MQTAVPETIELPPELLEDAPPQPKGQRWYPPVFGGEPREVLLSPRMADVLVGVMKGHTAQQIAKVLWVTEHTVKTHAKRLYQKMGARNQAHAVALFCTGEVEVYVAAHAKDRRQRVSLADLDDRL